MGCNNAISCANKVFIIPTSFRMKSLSRSTMNFCNKISPITGLTFTLPTEAQWEFAAKGGKYSQGYILAGGNNPGFCFPKMRLMMVIKVLHMMLDYFHQMN